MIFKSLRIKEGGSEKLIRFSSSVNLIYSQNNSCGKTTLLRLLLYSLGYNIPSTKKIKFSQCEVTAVLNLESIGEVSLRRYQKDVVELTIRDAKKFYVLPEDLFSLHAELFGTENKGILANLLGSYYFDQEKGWTLLNRGVVIGKNRFNIEDLVRGLSNIDCSRLLERAAELENSIDKLTLIYSIAEYKEGLNAEAIVGMEAGNERLNAIQIQLSLQKKSLEAELRRLDRILKDNRRFQQFIEDIKLLVMGEDGRIIRVKQDNIVGLNDSIDLIISKKKYICTQLSDVNVQLQKINRDQEKKEVQLSLWESLSFTDEIDKQLLNLPITSEVVKKELVAQKAELKELRKQISSITKNNNEIVEFLNAQIRQYAKRLELDCEFPSNYVFTDNLKELSGAVLHKLVFAFRLAYIVAIQNTLGIKLPIIMDSPSGKEIDHENIEMMIKLLKEDFSDNQLIVASIYPYNFENVNVIKIDKKLMT